VSMRPTGPATVVGSGIVSPASEFFYFETALALSVSASLPIANRLSPAYVPAVCIRV
jgi:hypothetical protein